MDSPQAQLPDSDDPGRRSSNRLPEAKAHEYQGAAYRGFHVQGPAGLQKSEQARPGVLRCGLLHGQPLLGLAQK